MLVLFKICFGVGLGYAVLAFLLEYVLGIFDFSGIDSIDFDGIGDVQISPFKPSIIAAFLVVFGGVGLLLIENIMIYFAFTFAAAAGLAVSYLIYRFIYVPLYKAQNTSAVDIQSLVGRTAKVTESIPQGGYGKITYYVNGNTYNSPAKAESGGAISRNTEVEIKAIVENTYYVETRS